MAANAFEGAAPPDAITHPPSSNEYLVDRGFRLLAICAASLIVLLVAYILWKIGGQALPAVYNYHLGFLTSTNWNVQEAKFRDPPRDLGDALQLFFGVADRWLLWADRRDFSDAGFFAAAHRVGLSHDHRYAGGDPERGVWPVGHLCRDPRHPADRQPVQ